MRYRIKTVSERLGVPKNTLIAWEQRYAFPRPARLPNGYRVYSDRDVAELEALKRLLDSGLQISEAVELIRGGGGPGEHRVNAPLPDGRESTPPPAPVAPPRLELQALEPIWRSALGRLLEFDRPGAELALVARAGMPFTRQIDGLYFPLLREVGSGWEAGRISVAQEHFASAFCRDHLAAMLLQLEGGGTASKTAVCASITGDRHELGALGLAVRLVIEGQRVVYLGADVPLEELSRCACSQGVSSVWVSIICSRSEQEVLSYARALRRTLPSEVRVVLGGRGLPLELQGTLDRIELARRYEEVLEPRGMVPDESEGQT